MGSTPIGGGGQDQAWVPWGGAAELTVKDPGPSSMTPPGVLVKPPQNLQGQGLAPDHQDAGPGRGHEVGPTALVSANPTSLRALDVMKPSLPFFRWGN